LGLLNVWSELRLTAVTRAAILSIPGSQAHGQRSAELDANRHRR
jgi:hypothetical protein